MSVITRKSVFIPMMAFMLIGCSAANEAVNTAASAASSEAASSSAAQSTSQAVKSALEPAANIADAPSGEYEDLAGHAYIAMSYDHQGYARPILRWGDFDASVTVDSENPENSSLEVVIDAASIDSGVERFDQHLVSADFFDVENHPEITFESTQMSQIVQGRGKVTGDLTIKGITKPVTMDVTLNKVGKHFQNGQDIFGISAKTMLRRDDFGVGKYDIVGQEVEVQIEVEFLKVE